MNIFSILFAIILCVGGCNCMPFVPVKPTVANFPCKLISHHEYY